MAPSAASDERCIPRLTAAIDLGAIRHNLGRARALAPSSKVMAAVKADAYGHGAVPVSQVLTQAGVDALAVACLEEALQLRAAGIETPIVLLEGVLSAAETRVAAAENLQIVVHAPWQLALLQALPAATSLQLWIKLDTGMHRLGFAADQAQAVYAAVQRQANWNLRGWITHLARADETGSPMTQQQVTRFERALKDLPGDRSIANSAGLIAFPSSHSDWVRPGLMLYGASPFRNRSAADLGLRPAMHLHSRIIALHDIAAGEAVGYGATWRSQRPARLAVVAAGYADGVRRALPSGTPVGLHGQRVPMAGRVSMDMITLDVTAVPEAQVGDTVTLWGDGVPVEEIAALAGTISYELFCGLTHRVHFRYDGAAL